MISKNSFVYSFREIGKRDLALVGGKGANLGELARIEGIGVPDGFCVATTVFKKIIDRTPSVGDLLDQLSVLKVDDRNEISELSRSIRSAIESTVVPEDIKAEITSFLSKFGERNAFAVRSSATTEDLPTASFAGQHDTYLNVIGKDAILKHICKCWASLFTDRAVVYRIQNGFDHHKVSLAVVVQKMIFPQVSGIMFTADPVSSNRKVISIDASFGLGEALVSGIVNADVYKIRNGEITDKKIAAKKVTICAVADGGTKEQQLAPEQQNKQALTDEQILQLQQTGRKIEAHFGSPQDIEWCLADGTFYIVQSRPITTLFPIPEVHDRDDHVYISVGHQQMMTDALRPLGLSLFQLTALRPMYKAGGRLFVDVMQAMSSPVTRTDLLEGMGQHDPLIKDAFVSLIERGDFIKPLPAGGEQANAGKDNAAPFAGAQPQLNNDPAIVAELISSNESSIEELKQNIKSRSGGDLLDFILEDIQKLKKALTDPKSVGALKTGFDASAWLNNKMNEWLGERNIVDTLSQSAPNNVTSEMGLALMDVADVIRPYPEVINYLQQTKDENFLNELDRFHGGQEVRNAIVEYLSKYGMRCAGEIDITRECWSERPIILVPMLLNNVKNFEHGAGHKKFENGLREALKKEQELLSRLRQQPNGEQKAEEAKQMITVLRNFVGYREYPKYTIVGRYFIYKHALLKLAEQLVRANVIQNKEDIYFLTFQELQEVVRTNTIDPLLLDRRKDEYRSYKKLTPPRVITSDGEIPVGRYKRDHLPGGAIVGLAVSSGIVEGRARVILNMEDAELEEGDILVTTFTDPSWTPLFVSIKGLVTEVGGLMTHGAVIAREYGLPAVVGVENATRLIKDGQNIRVNGTDGYIEIL